MTRNATRAPVNRVIPLSTVDGPGARSAVFLQGCNISCVYCHNPETQQLCRSCGVCVPVCPAGALSQVDGVVKWSREKCSGCDACVAVCPHYASPKVTWFEPREIFAELEPNIPFIRGITVSGGECMLYPRFLEELFTLARSHGLGCLIDSNGTVDFSQFPSLMEVTDGVMLDVKAWEPAVYSALVGAKSNGTVKRNLEFLSRSGKLCEIRVVTLPGYVDAEAVLAGAADTLGQTGKSVRLKLIAFRPHGVRGEAARMSAPAPHIMEALRQQARGLGFLNIQIV